MQLCAECKNWSVNGFKLPDGYGECEAIKSEESTRFIAYMERSEEACDPSLITRAEFGCILFKAK